MIDINDWVVKRLLTKTDYNPKHKYVIVKCENGLGKVWYRIRRLGWFWNSWYKGYYDTDYGLNSIVPEFSSREAAIDHLNSEKEKYSIKLKQNQVTTTNDYQY